MEMNMATSGSITDGASATISIQVESAELLFQERPGLVLRQQHKQLTLDKELDL